MRVTPPRFDVAWLQANSFVRRFELHEELASTNTRALDLAACEEQPTPLVVLCERQTSGRGRGTNQWWSAEGSLTFSLLLDAASLNLPPARFPCVSLAAGVSVCEALQSLLPANAVGLKWPNDVHLDGRKACGILVELPPRSRRLVIGVGINVNNSLGEAPDDVRERAISLADAAGVCFDPSDVLLAVLQRIERNLQLLAADDAMLAEKWSRLSVLTGRHVSLDAGSRTVRGRCLGIGTGGALLLETNAGQERFLAGVVTRIE